MCIRDRPTTVSATGDGGVSGTADVTVTEVPVLNTIEVSPSSATLYVGETQEFTATGKDQYGDPIETGAITWASSDTHVGTISETGLFTAVGSGATTVSATSGDVVGTATVTVEAAPSAPTAYVNIELSKQTVWRWWRVTATVTITSDSAGTNPIDGATVQGDWSGAYTGDVSGTTNGDGKVSFKTGFIRTEGMVTFIVNSVVKNGQQYMLVPKTPTGSINGGSSSRDRPR